MFKHPTLANRIKYKKLRGVSQRIQKDAQSTSWVKYVSSVNSNTEPGKIWKKVDKIKGKYSPRPTPTLEIDGEKVTSPREVANAFAKCYSAISQRTKTKYATHYKQAQLECKRLLRVDGDDHPDNPSLNSPFTLEELDTQLAKCKDTTPGLDDITIPMIKHLSTEARTKLLEALNQLWDTRSFPDSWRREIKIPFLKPGKNPLHPESYRPISLTSCVGKLFERMINSRLMWFLEKNNLLCSQQSGFRKNKSTMDALSQLIWHIEEAFKEKKHTTVVFFDMEKAYDTVWRDEIINSLHRYGIRGNLLHLVRNFLTNREFCVRIGASRSDYFLQEEGLPQGSILSVTCFAVAINDIVKQLSAGVQCSLYVDDFAIFASSKNETYTSRAIQTSINRLAEWSKSKGLKFSSEKTMTVRI